MTRKQFGIGIAVIVLIIIIGIVIHITSRAAQVVDKVASVENIISSYEQYQEMYNTCEQLCANLKVLKSADVDESSGFSRGERIANVELQLNRWIEEYNAKSKMITKNLWKSEELPFQIKREDFICNPLNTTQ